MSGETRTPNARRKMSETQFFHWKSVSAAETPSTDAPGAFGYYLSAFLCAADSVTDVAVFELRNSSLISAWRGTLSDDDQAFLRSMQDSRRVEVHRSGVTVEPQPIEFDIGSFVYLGELRRVVPERILIAGDGRYGVIAACRRYLGLLADMLRYIEAQPNRMQ